MTDLWQPALCQTCRTRPAKKAGRKQCWWCTHPGVDPPPCKVCGIPKYFFNGFCEPCHPSRAHTARSCLHCFAWGVHHGRRCYACHVFTNRNPVGKCQSCRRELPLVTGYCRLCWHQARLRASHDDHGPAQQFLHLAGNGQQLFFAHMARPASPNIPPKKPRPAVAATRRLTQVLTERQLVLFDATRDLSRFQTHHRDPSNPQVIIGRQVAEALAEQRGWPKFTLESVDRGMVILFSQQPAGVPVPYSEVAQLTDRSISVERVCEVLAELSLLQDDRVDTLDAWFTDRTAPLSAMVRDEVRVWFEVLRGQRGRSRIRKPDTIRGYIHYALPHLVALSRPGSSGERTN